MCELYGSVAHCTTCIFNQNGRRGALYYVYFHENITKTGCCTFYAQLWNGPRELLIRLDGFKAVGGANDKL